nr:hypothetical protein SBE_002684 [Streptomyces sp. SBE_14.2]
MIHPRPRGATRLAGCAAVLSALLLTSCTSSDSGASHPAASPAPSGPSEKTLTDRAQAALAAVSSGTSVEAGAERLSDGIHTEPTLRKGKTYRLNLACAGTGSARVEFVPEKAGTPTSVPCDESIVQHRLTGDGPLRIDVAGAGGSTGVIAWEIDAL